MEQRSAEWFQARIGKVTASRIADVMAKTKTGYSASRANYMAELICERLTGAASETYSNAAMLWGIEQELRARAAYEFETGHNVLDCGFIEHPAGIMGGASPDGLIPKDGVLEIKCPNTATHLDYLLSGKIPEKYILQMHWQMICADAVWADYVSFDPRLPPNLQIKIERVHRNKSLENEIEEEVKKFLNEMNEKLTKLESLNA